MIFFKGNVVHYLNGTQIKSFSKPNLTLNYELNQIWIGYWDGNRNDQTLASIEFYLKAFNGTQVQDAMKQSYTMVYDPANCP